MVPLKIVEMLANILSLPLQPKVTFFHQIIWMLWRSLKFLKCVRFHQAIILLLTNANYVCKALITNHNTENKETILLQGINYPVHTKYDILATWSSSNMTRSIQLFVHMNHIAFYYITDKLQCLQKCYTNFEHFIIHCTVLHFLAKPAAQKANGDATWTIEIHNSLPFLKYFVSSK